MAHNQPGPHTTRGVGPLPASRAPEARHAVGGRELTVVAGRRLTSLATSSWSTGCAPATLDQRGCASQLLNRVTCRATRRKSCWEKVGPTTAGAVAGGRVGRATAQRARARWPSGRGFAGGTSMGPGFASRWALQPTSGEGATGRRIDAAGSLLSLAQVLVGGDREGRGLAGGRRHGCGGGARQVAEKETDAPSLQP